MKSSIKFSVILVYYRVSINMLNSKPLKRIGVHEIVQKQILLKNL